jgi:hypothetical protein
VRIDNSAAKLFLECPLKYFERYEQNLELASRDTEGLDFGTRWHALQAERNLGREFCSHCGAGLGAHRREGEGLCEHCMPLSDARLEAEAQATFAAYLQHYGPEVREVVDVERTLVVTNWPSRLTCSSASQKDSQFLTTKPKNAPVNLILPRRGLHVPKLDSTNGLPLDIIAKELELSTLMLQLGCPRREMSRQSLEEIASYGRWLSKLLRLPTLSG